MFWGQLVISDDIYRKAGEIGFRMVYNKSPGGSINLICHCLKLSVAGDRFCKGGSFPSISKVIMLENLKQPIDPIWVN